MRALNCDVSWCWFLFRNQILNLNSRFGLAWMLSDLVLVPPTWRCTSKRCSERALNRLMNNYTWMRLRNVIHIEKPHPKVSSREEQLSSFSRKHPKWGSIWREAFCSLWFKILLLKSRVLRTLTQNQIQRCSGATFGLELIVQLLHVITRW